MKIFVTVGSMYPFDRLTKAIDDLPRQNKKMDVFIQTGESKLHLKHSKHTSFLGEEELSKKIKWANIVVSHAGAGSIVTLMASKKPFVLFPRLKKYGEAVDDHQKEICGKLAERYGVIFTENEALLPNAFQKAKSRKAVPRKQLLAKEVGLLLCD